MSFNIKVINYWLLFYMGILNFFKKDISLERVKKWEEFDKMFSEDGEMKNNMKATWLVNAGNYCVKKKNYTEAKKYYKEALGYKSDFLPAYFSTSFLYKKLGDMNKAEQIINNAPNEMKLYGKVITTKEGAMRDMLNNKY